jgi:hypothetical protein
MPIDNNGKGEAFRLPIQVENALASCMMTVMGTKKPVIDVDFR